MVYYALWWSPGWVRNLSLSPDSQRLATGSCGGGTLRVLSMGRGEELQHWTVEAFRGELAPSFLEVNDVQYSSSGLLAFKSTDGRVFTSEEQTSRKGHARDWECCRTARWDEGSHFERKDLGL